MNENHAQVCVGPEWAEYLHTEVIPEVTARVELGRRLLEVGPGPGAATEVLHGRVERLSCRSSPTTSTRPPRSPCSTMLPTAALQNRLLAEILRVLRPGGVLVGMDSLASVDLHHFHEGDTYNPVEPAALLVRLQTLGYERITITVDHAMKFVPTSRARTRVAPPGNARYRTCGEPGRPEPGA